MALEVLRGTTLLAMTPLALASTMSSAPFNNTYNASAFTSSSGPFNQFLGNGGNDTITGKAALSCIMARPQREYQQR